MKILEISTLNQVIAKTNKTLFISIFRPKHLLIHLFWYSKMLKPLMLSSWMFWQQVWNFISPRVCGEVCTCVSVFMHVYVSEHTCGWTLLYLWKQSRSCEMSPHSPHMLRGPIQAPGGIGQYVPWGLFAASVWRLLWQPVCKHSIHRWYERLSEMWWLSSELGAGDCCHLRVQRWDWLREGETQKVSLTW